MVWLRDAPAGVAAVPKAAPAAQLKVRGPKPVAVAAVELLPAAAVRVAEVPAPVTGVEFAPPPIALGTPAPRRWVQPPEAVQPPPGWAAMAQASLAAQEAQRRQVMAALQRQAAQAEARCPTHEPQWPDCEREAQ